MENFDQYYRSYKYMQKHLATDFTAHYLYANMADNDHGKDILSGKLHDKVIDLEWVIAIEDTIPYIEKAIDEQRRFMIENFDVYRIEKAKMINKDSVKHLIQHTNFIDHIDERGTVTPNRVLTIEREDSFETYENRFLITLIENALHFVSDKYRKMVDAPTDTVNMVRMERNLMLNNQHITFKMEYANEVTDAKAALLDLEDYTKLSDFDRVRRIREKLNTFFNTDMMQSLKKCVRVKPPINRTNLMTKNPNYKACLDLFTYLGAYNKPGYEIIDREFSGKMDKTVQEAVYMSQGFQHFMLSIAMNPALKRLLEERYQEYRAGHGKMEDSETEAIIETVRKQELTIRLEEIRKREAIIRDQKVETAALKSKIDQCNKTIKVREETITRLENELQRVKNERIKAEKRVVDLEEETAQQKSIIASQTATITDLESEIATTKMQIANLTLTLATQDELIAKHIENMDSLRNTIAVLTDDLTIEKQRHLADIEASDAAIKAKEKELTELFDRERNHLQNKHRTEMETRNKAHQKAMERLNQQKECEKTKILKSAESRIKIAQKEAEKKAKKQIQSEVGKAQAKVKAAAKKANEAAVMYKKEREIDCDHDGWYQYNFIFGALGLQALKAETFSFDDGDRDHLPDVSAMRCFYMVRDNKKVTVYKGTYEKLRVLKKFRGTTNLDVCQEFVKEQLKGADFSCAYMRYQTVDQNDISNFASFLKNRIPFGVVRTFHNITQKSGSPSIAIYYYEK